MNHIGTQPLETQRLILRRIEPRDAQDMFEMYSQERAVRFLHVPLHTDISQDEEYIASAIADYEKPDCYRWAIELKADGSFVGACSLFTRSERDEVGEVGYCVTPERWGNGYMSEALRAVLGFAFKEVGFNRIEAGHSTRNPASGAVMRKAGMLYEGMMREKYKNSQGYHDTHEYAILKSDY